MIPNPSHRASNAVDSRGNLSAGSVAAAFRPYKPTGPPNHRISIGTGDFAEPTSPVSRKPTSEAPSPRSA
jgi:hypothetical protein